MKVVRGRSRLYQSAAVSRSEQLALDDQVLHLDYAGEDVDHVEDRFKPLLQVCNPSTCR
jgi:hypothetical protein